MTVGVLALYRFKIRLFLSPIRRQPAAAVALILVAMMVLPSTFFFGYYFPDAPFAQGSLVETLALPLSIFAAVGILAAPGGGMLLQPAEVDFVAVAPVSVRRFALADALFQATIFGVSLPAVALVALGYVVRTSLPLWAVLVPVAVFAVSLFVFALFVQAVGIARLLRRRWATPLAVTLFLALLAPAIARFVLRQSTAYALLPYPTTATVQVALLPFGWGDWIGVPVLAVFAGVAFLAHEWAVRHPSLPNLRGTFGFAFTPEAKRSQQEALLRVVSRFRRGQSSRIYRPTIVGTMAGLHTVRMMRDGTVFLSLILVVAFGLPSLMSAGAFGFAGLYIVLFLPIAAVGQWMVTDRSNLWVLATAGGASEAFFLGWWIAMGALVTTIGSLLSLFGGLSGGVVDGVGLAATVAGAVGSTAGAVAAAAKFPYAPNEFSARPFLHFLLTGSLAGAGALPVFVFGFLMAANPIAFGLAASGIILALAVLMARLVSWAGRRPNL